MWCVSVVWIWPSELIYDNSISCRDLFSDIDNSLISRPIQRVNKLLWSIWAEAIRRNWHILLPGETQLKGSGQQSCNRHFEWNFQVQCISESTQTSQADLRHVKRFSCVVFSCKAGRKDLTNRPKVLSPHPPLLLPPEKMLNLDTRDMDTLCYTAKKLLRFF